MTSPAAQLFERTGMKNDGCNSELRPIHSLTKDKLSLDLFIKVEFTESRNYL